MDVLFFDDRGGFGPTFNSLNAVGGAEMHLVQVAEYLASVGCSVSATIRGVPGVEGGVTYEPHENASQRNVGALIVVGCASLPDVTATRAFAFQVVDPRPHPHMWDHLKGKATMVCVSEWQANLFRSIGHKAVVIPVPIPDEWYGAGRADAPYDFVCLSSWNKGARETINRWQKEWGTLAVGSAYSHPSDSEDIIRQVMGVKWLGTLRPREKWVEAMMNARAVARVCTIGETFGVVDVAAMAMGIPCYTLCTGDTGSLREVGAKPFLDAADWRYAVANRINHPDMTAERFRGSVVLPQWIDLLEGKINA